jgi:hypothetical protein
VISRVLAAGAVLLSVAVLVALFAITGAEGDSPAWWYVVLLLAAVTGLGYGMTSGSHRVTALLVASILLLALGLLGIFSVGLPLLLAGVLGLVAATRTLSVTPGAAGP